MRGNVLVRAEWRRMDRALRRASAYAHPAGRIVRIETHISVIYLAGRYAYKICKPVTLGFVDFTTRSARYRACQDALRLNRRLAPTLYVGVVPIVRTGRVFKVGATGKPFDHALKMHRFDERDTLSALASRDELHAAHIDRLASRVALFHATASAHVPSAELGTSGQVGRQLANVLASLEREAPLIVPGSVAHWCREEMDRLKAHMDKRRADGFVRECHGDLHLDNMVRRGSDVLIFDCIEFSDALRWTDVTADTAFVVMDLLASGRGDLATRFLNKWLASSGDFAGLPALRLYVVYRSLVRVLATILKHCGRPLDGGDLSRVRSYLGLAARLTVAPSAFLIVCHGFSGSGKSAASEALAQLSGAIRISSDVERKRSGQRLFGRDTAPSHSQSAYTEEAIDANYAKLREMADAVLSAGFPVIVDASFLKHVHRASFIELAAICATPIFIVDFHADTNVLVERLAKRAGLKDEPSDADESVLLRQLGEHDRLTDDELALTVSIDTGIPLESFGYRSFWHSLLERLGSSRGWLAGW